MSNDRRLIEAAFPLKQASLDSVHEKNVRHGHISTLHIWPARRPLAACRAALIATLLPDPGDEQERRKLVEKIGGRVRTKSVRKKLPSGRVEEVVVEYTEGGVLHWGRESDPDMDWFRKKIREAYGGRAPKVLDPFAGGGAIPLEAMRLGCEATAVDINPVAWFILKCTLEYPQKLAGKKLPLPEFVLKDHDFMEAFFKAQGLKGAALKSQLGKLGLGERKDLQLEVLKTEDISLEADLAWQVRAWGWWVLQQARKELARFYPAYAEFEPLHKVGKWERRPMKLIPLKDDCTLDLEPLNAEFGKAYLDNPSNPRWIAKPTVAYLWARTVTCKNCRATIPLLKTRWLCKKDRKRVLLTMQPNADRTGVVFGIQNNVPVEGNNPAQRREHDKRIGQGTVTRNGVWCPCCGKPETVAMTTEDIRLEGQAGRLGAAMTAVVVDPIKPRLKRRAGDESATGKEYRLPTDEEVRLAAEAGNEIERPFAEIPFGVPDEPTPAGGGSGAGRAFAVQSYGIRRWRDLFTHRQLLALGQLCQGVREAIAAQRRASTDSTWVDATAFYLAAALSRVLDFLNCGALWKLDADCLNHSFVRFALPVSWDFAEASVIADSAGSFSLCYERVCTALDGLNFTGSVPRPAVRMASACVAQYDNVFDAIVTDPPYYDAIPYSDLMDFFYVWLRRTLFGINDETQPVFAESLAPKWDHESADGELIDDSSRFDGDEKKSKAAYEEGMARSFAACHNALLPEGRLIIVFAHKHPDAWETLVSAIIRAGFVVDGSWPIQTEMGNRTRAMSSAALASSVWLVCKKRPETALPGWDNKVLDEMRANITDCLREFWDAGIRGPDFVWAATGPAMEAYSKYPIVKKADKPGELMSVSEFLRHVRRIVVDFVVGRVLAAEGEDEEAAGGLDDVTTYYLLHRHDFGLKEAPAGACILYSVSCGLSDAELASRYDILTKGNVRPAPEDENMDVADDGEFEEDGGSGSTLKLKPWNQRKSSSMGYDGVTGVSQVREESATYLGQAVRSARAVPLIDQVHRLMHLWNAGDQNDVDEYLDLRGLRRNSIFKKLLQALIELAPRQSEERSILESLSNHVQVRGEGAVQPELLPD